MSIAQQKLHIVELKEARKLEEARKKVVNAISYLTIAFGSSLVMAILALRR